MNVNLLKKYIYLINTKLTDLFVWLLELLSPGGYNFLKDRPQTVNQDGLNKGTIFIIEYSRQQLMVACNCEHPMQKRKTPINLND